VTDHHDIRMEHGEVRGHLPGVHHLTARNEKRYLDINEYGRHSFGNSCRPLLGQPLTSRQIFNEFRHPPERRNNVSQFKDRVALVTGGGSGIGEAVAKELASKAA
jgi:hypothetical protein